jgi:thiamine pyrophosphate-dependent acetolactate synthase large subunit-like protein
MMTHREALEIVAANRTDRVVVTTMGSVGIWPSISDSERDFHYQPSSMGQGVPLALGLCLAKPGLGVIVLTGDGGLIMNLGCLITAAQHDMPLAVVLIDNGLYEVTGGQDVAGARRTDFASIARGAGFKSVQQFETADDWRNGAKAALTAAGPSFSWLAVEGERGHATPSAPRPMHEQIARLQSAIA